jgi:hypothetical protein
MPISYRIVVERQLVEAKLTGEITIADLKDYATRIAGDPSFSPDFYMIVEFSGIKTSIKSMQFQGFGRWRNTKPKAHAIAIVAIADFDFGIARMYEQTASEGGNSTLQVFRSYKEAYTWLGLPPE